MNDDELRELAQKRFPRGKKPISIQLRDQILADIKEHGNISAAAKRAGVHRSTAHRIMHAIREEHGED